MTGDALMPRALRLLNYTDPRGEIDRTQTAELWKRGLTLIDLLLADVLPIEGKEIQTLDVLTDELPVSGHTAAAVLPYGLAMLLAQSEGDGDNQQLMAAMYNQKRGSIRHPAERVSDVLPVPTD